MKKINFISLAIGVIIYSSCVDEIKISDLGVDTSKLYYVFNGGLYTDSVAIVGQRSQPIGNNGEIVTSNYISDATISIFEQTDPNDKSTASSIANIPYDNSLNYYVNSSVSTSVGRYYWIRITLNDGSIFESTPERLRNNISLNSLTVEVSSEFDIENNGYQVKSYFKIQDDTSEKNYFIYIARLYDKDNTLRVSLPEEMEEVYTISEDFITRDNTISNTFLSDNLIYYDSDPNNSSPYTMDINFWNVSYDSYEYIKDRMNDLNRDGESPGYNPFGNIANTTTEEKTIGFFTVANRTTITKGSTTLVNQ